MSPWHSAAPPSLSAGPPLTEVAPISLGAEEVLSVRTRRPDAQLRAPLRRGAEVVGHARGHWHTHPYLRFGLALFGHVPIRGNFGGRIVAHNSFPTSIDNTQPKEMTFMCNRSKKQNTPRESAVAVDSLEPRDLFWSWGEVATPTQETQTSLSQSSVTVDGTTAIPVEQVSVGDIWDRSFSFADPIVRFP
jgi:hypothetical protein